MASYSLYDVVVPTYTRGLNTFEHILRKAEVFAKDKGIDADAELVPARLVADQLPLVFQVQNATKSVAVYTALLTGTPVHAFENTESTFADLYARLDAARALLATITPELAAANADKTTTFTFGGRSKTLTATQAVLQQALPNFIFHLSTGYSILRSKGAPVGKEDYISSFLEL